LFNWFNILLYNSCNEETIRISENYKRNLLYRKSLRIQCNGHRRQRLLNVINNNNVKNKNQNNGSSGIAYDLTIPII